MAKPTKGNKTKRPNSDEGRLKAAHLKALKGNVAIVSSSFKVPEGFKTSKVTNTKIRVKGVGAQAIKQASNKVREEVITAVAQRNWTRVVTLIPDEGSLPVKYNKAEDKEEAKK